jgi:hypothetical protein
MGQHDYCPIRLVVINQLEPISVVFGAVGSHQSLGGGPTDIYRPGHGAIARQC